MSPRNSLEIKGMMGVASGDQEDETLEEAIRIVRLGSNL